MSPMNHSNVLWQIRFSNTISRQQVSRSMAIQQARRGRNSVRCYMAIPLQRRRRQKHIAYLLRLTCFSIASSASKCTCCVPHASYLISSIAISTVLPRNEHPFTHCNFFYLFIKIQRQHNKNSKRETNTVILRTVRYRIKEIIMYTLFNNLSANLYTPMYIDRKINKRNSEPKNCKKKSS